MEQLVVIISKEEVPGLQRVIMNVLKVQESEITLESESANNRQVVILLALENFTEAQRGLLQATCNRLYTTPIHVRFNVDK